MQNKYTDKLFINLNLQKTLDNQTRTVFLRA